ncbi:hypothetical protein [Halalkalibacter akibai]|uniref:hypothetical protein n=1 Tax=Halalkalibacter akibai TaxID=1411 RepID=UPI00054F1AF4|nr:hypothetical protein [Halalkalibacter akibai]
MDLNIIWEKFLTILDEDPNIKAVTKQVFTGIPFIYITPVSETIQIQKLNDLLSYAAAKSMKGKRLSCDLSFVRMKSQTFVYRARFKVPQEKLFCCGNGCTDCVRLKQQ